MTFMRGLKRCTTVCSHVRTRCRSPASYSFMRSPTRKRPPILPIMPKAMMSRDVYSPSSMRMGMWEARRSRRRTSPTTTRHMTIGPYPPMMRPRTARSSRIATSCAFHREKLDTLVTIKDGRRFSVVVTEKTKDEDGSEQCSYPTVCSSQKKFADENDYPCYGIPCSTQARATSTQMAHGPTGTMPCRSSGKRMR